MSISYAISVDAAADNSSHVSRLYSSFHSQVTLLLCGVKKKHGEMPDCHVTHSTSHFSKEATLKVATCLHSKQYAKLQRLARILKIDMLQV